MDAGGGGRCMSLGPRENCYSEIPIDFEEGLLPSQCGIRVLWTCVESVSALSLFGLRFSVPLPTMLFSM